MEEMMISSQDSGPAWYNYSADSIDMDFTEIGGLFELVVPQAGSGSGSGSSMEMQPTMIPSSLLSQEIPFQNDMATWLCPIMRGEEVVAGQYKPGGHDVNDQIAAPEKKSSEKLPSTEGRGSSQETSSDSSERKKTASGVKRSYIAETHKLTEKRRRRKINEMLKTLQQLVPGCDKSNQASTLDHTIKYMKSLQQQIQVSGLNNRHLQQQIQAMSCGCGMKPASATVYPSVQPPAVAAGLAMPLAAAPGMLVGGHVRPGLVLGSLPAIVPFAPVLPLVHHPAAMTHAAQMPYPNLAQLRARGSRSKLEKKE